MLNKQIWFVDQYIGHPRYGNVYRNFHISQELQKNGAKVRIFTASYSHLMYAYPETTGLLTREVIDGVEFNWIKVRPYKDGKSLGRIFSIFEFTLKVLFLRKFSPPDFLITPSVSLLPYLSVRLLRSLWRKKPKVIFEVRDLWPLTLIKLGGNSRNHPFIGLLSFTERYAYKTADYIISTLRMCDRHIKTVTAEPFRFKWIDNGINVSAEEPELPAEIRKVIPENKFLVGYTGSLGLANSMESFVECASRLATNPEIHFVIVGEGYERENLMQQAKNLDNITFIPRVNKTLIPAILSLFDVLYLSYSNVPDLYKYGVSANKTYEYMLAGKPILLSSVKMDYNIIEEADCGIVIEPEQPAAIKSAIETLFGYPPETRKQMGENAVRYILEHNTFEILSKRLIEVFHELETDPR